MADQTHAHKHPHAEDSRILLLSCMDLRLLDKIGEYMKGRGLTNRYDHVILAGASLGAVYDRNSHWGQTFWDHVDIAIQLHQVEGVIILDHRDCGAYRVFLGQDLKDDPAAEERKHAEIAHSLRQQIQQRYPHLRVECLLMDLKGKVIELHPEDHRGGRDAIA